MQVVRAFLDACSGASDEDRADSTRGLESFEQVRGRVHGHVSAKSHKDVTNSGASFLMTGLRIPIMKNREVMKLSSRFFVAT